MRHSNIYRRTFFATCPNNGQTIEYSLQIKTSHVVMAEQIVEACEEAKGLSRPYHENIADLFFAKFGGVQKITAYHHGVEIETRRG